MIKLFTPVALAAILLLSSCGSKDLSQVKTGMTASEVESLVGKPDQKIEMPFNNAFWKYGENQMLTMNSDTVAAVILDAKKFAEDMQTNMEAGFKAAEEARENLNNVGNALAAEDTSVVINTTAE